MAVMALQDIPQMMTRVLQAMTPTKRLETAFYLARLARQMMAAQTRQGHPEWTGEQVNRHVAERILRGAK
jgi:hypothetical protein